MTQPHPRVAVVGAGLAGLACAERLVRGGIDVAVFDKGHGAGGRSSTRRADALRFDFGAGCVRARTPGFRARVEAWEAEGALARWTAPWVRLEPGGVETALPPEPTWVGVPGMSSLIRYAGRGLDVRYGARVLSLERDAAGWWLALEARREGPFAGVVLALPAPQAQSLVRRQSALRERFEAPSFTPTWAALVRLERPQPLTWGRALASEGPLEVLSREHTKPGRPESPAWVLQASDPWSEEHVDDAPEEVGPALLSALEALCGPLPGATLVSTHRWRFARARAPWGLPCAHDAELGFGVCGDWCVGRDLEAAYLSGSTLGAAWAEASR
ncbi:MAG: FAD-dependent oxidoreductase [Planctomycetota bacterium]